MPDPRPKTAVRVERPGDEAAIRAVHLAAFATPAEASLVDALRDSPAWDPRLSLVAERSDVVVGHLLLSIAALDHGTPLLALAPVAVVPGAQRTGVGGALIEAGLRAAAAAGYAAVVVVGHPGYYPRFGFGRASELGIGAAVDVPDDAWMAICLAEGALPPGTVVYPPPFASL